MNDAGRPAVAGEAKGKRFRCANCGGWFTSPWTDAEASREAAKNFPEVGPQADTDEVCDPCYRKFMAWLEKHPEERFRHGWETGDGG